MKSQSSCLHLKCWVHRHAVLCLALTVPCFSAAWRPCPVLCCRPFLRHQKKHIVAIVHVPVSSINLYMGTFVCWGSLPIFVLLLGDRGSRPSQTPEARCSSCHSLSLSWITGRGDCLLNYDLLPSPTPEIGPYSVALTHASAAEELGLPVQMTTNVAYMIFC